VAIDLQSLLGAKGECARPVSGMGSRVWPSIFFDSGYESNDCLIIGLGYQGSVGQVKWHLFVTAGYVFRQGRKGRIAYAFNGEFRVPISLVNYLKSCEVSPEYGETWRLIRKIVHNSFNIRAARTYIPY
jgi:hypothetical protein